MDSTFRLLSPWETKMKVVNLYGSEAISGQFLHHSNPIEVAEAAVIPYFFWKTMRALESLQRCNVKFDKWSNIQENRYIFLE